MCLRGGSFHSVRAARGGAVLGWAGTRAVKGAGPRATTVIDGRTRWVSRGPWSLRYALHRVLRGTCGGSHAKDFAKGAVPFGDDARGPAPRGALPAGIPLGWWTDESLVASFAIVFNFVKVSSLAVKIAVPVG